MNPFKKTKTMDFSDATFVLLLVVCGNLFVQLIDGVALMTTDNSVIVNYVFMIIMELVFATIGILVMNAKKSSVEIFPFGGAKRRTKDSFIDIAVGVAIAVIALFTFSQTATVFDNFLSKYDFGTAFVADDAASSVLLVFDTVLLAPICEEFIFRGILLYGLMQVANKRNAVVLCGLAFALFHMNPLQTVYQFLLGCALALIAYESRSLVPSIAAHATNNLIAVIFLLVPQAEKFFSDFVNNFVTGWVALSVIPIAALGMVVIMLLARTRFVHEEQKPTEREQKDDDISQNADPHEDIIQSYAGARVFWDKKSYEHTKTEIKADDNEESELIDFGVRDDYIGELRKRPQKKYGYTMYFGALGICIFIWISVFVAAVFKI